jgi:hypothetical protein
MAANTSQEHRSFRERLSDAAHKAKNMAGKVANSPYIQRAHTAIKIAVPEIAAAEFAAKKGLSLAGSVASRVAAAKARAQAAMGVTNENIARKSAQILAQVKAATAAGVKSNNIKVGVDPTGKNINKLAPLKNVGSPVSSLGSPASPASLGTSPTTPNGKGGRKRTYKRKTAKRKTRKNRR